MVVLGNDPDEWPDKIDEFINYMYKLPELSAYEERRDILDTFFNKAINRLENTSDLKVKHYHLKLLAIFKKIRKIAWDISYDMFFFVCNVGYYIYIYYVFWNIL